MIRRLTSALGTRNLLVLGLVGSLALGGATVAFADDRDEAINRREDMVQAEVDARDDDDLDHDDATGNLSIDATGDRGTGENDASRTGRDRDTGITRDRDTGTGTEDGAAAPAPQDTGDTRSNDGTVGGDTTAGPRPQADDSNDGNSGNDDSGDEGSASGDSDD